MKATYFKQSVLTAGIIASLGMTGTAFAATSGAAAPTGSGVQIANIATASYAVNGVTQPQVESNEVLVNISELGSFSLIAPLGASTTDDINEKRPVTPGGKVNFQNVLKNTGNVNDTYTIKLDDTISTPLIPGASDDFSYTDESTQNINVVVTDATGQVVANDPDGKPYSAIQSGGTIKLAPGNTAALSYDVTPERYNDAGQSGLLTLSATSKYITDHPTNGVKPTLFNENQGILTNPIFAITKTANNTNVDLNNVTTIDYTIKVENFKKEYGADATNITVADAIPAGLDLVTTSIKITGPAGATKATTTTSNARNLEVKGIDLKQGEIATITFTVNISDKAALAAAGSVTNHATVYDAYDDSKDPKTNPDIKDSTDETTDGNTNGVDDSTDDVPGGTGGDTASVVNFTNRNLTMTTNNTVELAPTDSQTVTHTITNNGNQVEGDAADEVVVSLTEGTTGGDIKPTGPITVIIKDKDGVETTRQEFPAGTTSFDIKNVGDGSGIPVGGTADVTYTESSANNYDAGTKQPKTPSDTTVITVTPGLTAAPAPITNTDTFNVKVMDLLKEQAKDAECDGVADASFVTSELQVDPGQCVIYRITATNNFSTKQLTDVVISDAKSRWENKATFKPNSATVSVAGVTSPAGSVTEPGTAVVTSALTIPANSSAVLTFSLEVNKDQ